MKPQFLNAMKQQRHGPFTSNLRTIRIKEAGVSGLPKAEKIEGVIPVRFQSQRENELRKKINK